MKTPHKHAALIKQWADGAQIQYKEGDFWYITLDPAWKKGIEYRVKPEPKPDTVKIRKLTYNADCDSICVQGCGPGKGNIMFVFDGETGKLKDAQVLADV